MEFLVTSIDNMLLFLIYMAVATTFIPLPDFPVILHLAGMGAHPAWLVGLIGGIGTCAAGLIDYIIVAELRRLKRVERLLQNKHYKTMEYYFKKVAFLSIVLSGFLVFIPFDPFKLLAATARYDKYKYVLAIFIGRAPRYYLTAILGEQIRFHPAVLGAAFALLVAIPVFHFLCRKIRDRLGQTAAR